jgi:anti-sigma B factor antagonist
MGQAAARLHTPAQRAGARASDRLLDTGICLVPIKGDIDLASAPALSSVLVRLRQRGNRRFVLDLSRVTHMDSTGLGVLLSFYRTLDSAGAIAIAAPPQNVRKLLQITGIDRRFPVFPSVDEAIAGCRG